MEAIRMTYPIPFWKRVFWTLMMISGGVGYVIYEHWLGAFALVMAAYRLFQMDMLESTVQAFQITVAEYESGASEIEEYHSDQEEIEEREAGNQRVVLNSYHFAKRLRDTDGDDQ